jgi:hypothetical protein
MELDIKLRDHALDWYMILDVTRMIADVKKLLINEF